MSTQYIGRGILAGIQIPIDICGIVTGIGFVTASATTNQRFRFGIYADTGGGQPGVLVAQTAVGLLQSGANEVPVESTARIGCNGVVRQFFWLMGVWDVDAIDFESEANPGYPWIYATVVVPELLGNGGLKDPFPAPGMPLLGIKQPHLYVMVAQSNRISKIGD